MKNYLRCSKFKTDSVYQTTEDAVEVITGKLNNISVEDIDVEDRENPLLCSEYINDIYAYLKIMEIQYAVS